MDVMIEHKVVPKLRFREFEGIWTREKFKGLVKINQGLQIPISERYKEEVDNSYFYITNEFLKAKSDKKYYIKNPNKSVLCDVDDILMTRTGNTGMVVTNVKGAFHNNFFKIAYPSTIDKDFLFYFLNLTNTQNTIKRLAGTSTIPDLNHSDFYRIDFPITTLPEQQKISSFLSSGDEKLQQLNKKKELLEEYKKGVMQKIFSQELRFKDANGNNYPNWEEKNFKEVLKLLSSNQVGNNEMLDEGKYIVIEQGKKERLKYSNDITKLIKNNGIIVYGDHTTIIKYIDFDFIAGTSVKLLQSAREDDLSYLYYNLSYNNIKPEGYKRHFSILKQIYLQIPYIEEQNKIANFLSSLDSKIELVSTQIENTKAFKKGLLQQMFV